MKYVLKRSNREYGILNDPVAGYKNIAIYASRGSDIVAIVAVGKLTLTVVFGRQEFSNTLIGRCYLAWEGATQHTYEEVFSVSRVKYGNAVQYGDGYVTVEMACHDVEKLLEAGQNLAREVGWLK